MTFLEVWMLICLLIPLVVSVFFFFFSWCDLYGTTYHYHVDGHHHRAWVDDGTVLPGSDASHALDVAASSHLFCFTFLNVPYACYFIYCSFEHINLAVFLGIIIVVVWAAWKLLNLLVDIKFIMFLWKVLLVAQYVGAIGFCIYQLAMIETK